MGKYALETSPTLPGVAKLGQRLQKGDPATSVSRTVVATRLRATNVRWLAKQGTFTWDRVPTAVRALTADGRAYEPWRIQMPTPRPLTSAELLAATTVHAPNHIAWPIERSTAAGRALPPPRTRPRTLADIMRQLLSRMRRLACRDRLTPCRRPRSG